MPRPTKDDPRDCFKCFRFSAAEVTRLEARARARGQSLSAYVRSLLLAREQEDGEAGGFPEAAYDGNQGRAGGAPPTAAPVPSSRTVFAIRTLTEQLRRVGVNLNQIAHRMNEQRIPPPPDLTMLLDEIRAYVRQVREP
jgi:hypothetical protein